MSGAVLTARANLHSEFMRFHRRLLAIVREDAVCRRLMTVPGVGAVVALTVTSVIDDPARFASSKAVGPHFGLTPMTYQSGETDVTGAISKTDDALVRAALCEAGQVMLTRTKRFSTLKRWALEVANRRGVMRAKVALPRKLACGLHRLWVDGTYLRFGKETAAA
ncbi:transposase [Azospirillum canadense]|nr:transposase [Azospirillum canadense]